MRRQPLDLSERDGYGEPDPAEVMTGEEYDAAMLARAADPVDRVRMRADGGRYPRWLAEHLGLCPRCQRPNDDMDHILCELCRGFVDDELGF